MNKSPTAEMTFFRVGETPGSRVHLVPAPWSESSTPLSDGMKPLYREFYCDGAGGLKCGIWECGAGSVELCNCTAARVCFIQRGTLRLTDSREHSATFGAGECLVIPRGFNGIWSQSDDFAMAYALVGERDDAGSL